ncbi:MAG: hypothetical protein EPO32_04920 [Anaerolineae bacterium]|nr:MAG: hypothetical protein EPO32_04920 [Anaerolineae bacterium]
MSRSTILSILLVFALGACAAPPAPTASAEQVQAVISQLLTEQAASWTPTFTAAPPTATLTLTPTFTLQPTQTETPTPEFTATATPWAGIDPNAILIYYFIVGGGDRKDCGDRAVAFSTGYLKTGDPVKDVETALTLLFNNPQPYVGGLENPIGPSNININSITLNTSNNHVEVEASGTVIKNKDDYCQWDRMRAQVRATANKAAEPFVVNITFNGKPFNDFVSGDH